MRKILVGIIVALVTICLIPMSVLATGGTTQNIAVTATGSEVNITCDQTTWEIGTVSASETVITGTGSNWGTITNNSTEAVNVTIHGHDMTGSGVTWTLADDSVPGAATIGILFSKDDGDGVYDEGWTATNYVKKSTSYVEVATGLANAGTQLFGMKFFAPTSGVGNAAMTMGSSGVVLTAAF